MTRPDNFTARVLSVVRRIPPGHVATYGDVARLAGRPRAWRAVGNIMRGCSRPDIPCHRVIAAGGRIGGYGGSEALKRALLIAEGIVFSGSRVRGLDQAAFAPKALRRASPELAQIASERRRVQWTPSVSSQSVSRGA